MKKTFFLLSLFFLFFLVSCGPAEVKSSYHSMAIRVRHDTKRSWDAYRNYAWGKDVLLPLNISPIDAFSTLVIVGLTADADLVAAYVADSISFDKDFKAKVLEVNIRVLGGLVSMYQLTNDPEILEKAVDFGNRLLPAFQSETGIPYYWVNLQSGEVEGKRVNVAEAGTYLLEMGMLSYFTGDAVYYQAAKRSSRAIFDRRSELGLVGEVIDIESGEWINPTSHICAGTGSYYEYLYKGWLLFGDPELKEMWDTSIKAVLKYLPEEVDGRTWYGRVNMYTGERTSSVVTLWDAFMPALLAISGHLSEAADLQESWDWLWNKNGLEPMIYDYRADTILNPEYDLNPKIIESAWYLWELTGEERYMEMIKGYYADLMEYCSTDLAFIAIQDVRSKEQGDYMATYFLAETLKYLYLAFADQDMYNLESVVFSTEAHPYLKAALDPEKVLKHLGL
jgi:hypothetical protein